MFTDITQPLRFIHIKKNGGTSTYKFLRKHNIDCLIGDKKIKDEGISGEHSFARSYYNENSYKFCIVRNPFTRVVSFYNWIKRQSEYPKTFDEYVKSKYNRGRANGSWTLQIEYMYDKTLTTSLIDKVFYFENMEYEIKNFFNLPKRFPHLNKCTFESYNSYYTNETKQIVYEHFKKDFDLLGYNYA